MCICICIYGKHDRSQCLYFVLPIMWCAFGAHLDDGLAERSTPCRFIGTSTFSSLISAKIAVFDKMESLIMMPCAVLSLLPSRRSCPTRRS